MKTVLAFLFLAICLVVMPPGPSRATCIDDQIVFVADAGCIVPATVAVQEKGGDFVMQSSNYVVMHAMLRQSIVNKDAESTTIKPAVLTDIRAIYEKQLHKITHPPLCHNLLNYKVQRFARDGLTCS